MFWYMQTILYWYFLQCWETLCLQSFGWLWHQANNFVFPSLLNVYVEQKSEKGMRLTSAGFRLNKLQSITYITFYCCSAG